MKYIIITSAYNEEKYIEKTINSVIKQTVQPMEWIIVNDGSTDKTKDIVLKYCSKYKWIKVYNFKNKKRKFGEHVYYNFRRGYSRITSDDWNYIVKLDSDLEIDRKDFFEYQINQMYKNPMLGISSGITYSIENNEKKLTTGRPEWHTGGAMKFYRRECYNDIGGIKPLYGWDGLDEYQAMARGWITKTFFDLHVNHLGKERAKKRATQLFQTKEKGRSLYLRGYPFWFVCLKSVSFFKLSIKHSCYFLYGYLSSFIKKEKQYVNKKEKKFIRRFQYTRNKNRFKCYHKIFFSMG